jgi:hypothetical protein
MSYINEMKDLCINKTQFCESLKEFINNNTLYVKKETEKYGKRNSYWHHLNLVYKQLEGMQKGYELWQKNNNKTPEDQVSSVILMLNLQSEGETFEDLLNPSTAQNEGHCSALIKPLPDGSDLFVAHNTWASYETMLRIMKKYKFAFKSMDDKKELIPGHSVSFPSYPGVIFSSDDYYILSSGLVIQETTIDNYNDSLWENIHSDSVVFEFVRNIIANRLADSGKEWADIFAEHNSGTYNNQFMIIDYKKYRTGTKLNELQNDLLWVLEQMPGLIRAADVTQVLREQGYWASYNVPYFEDIFKISGNEDMARTNGSYFSYKSTARANIFRRDQSKVVDLKSLYKLMRYNDFKNDPFSKCAVYNQTCNPPYSADLTIAARNDLNDPNGEYSLDDWKNRGEGAIDVKITDSKMVPNLEMLAVCGPTDEQQPPFQWSTTNIKELKHEGQPNLFNFKPIYVKWYPNSYVNATDIK